MRLGGQRQMRATLSQLESLIPVPWSIDELVVNIAKSRRRPISLQPWGFPVGEREPSGVWIPTTKADYIFYRQDAAPTARDGIIGHEVGHMLLEHTPSLGGAPPGLLEALAPSVTPELARRFLSRTGYETAQEAQAEEFGTRLIRMGTTKRRPGGPDELGRLTDALR